MEPKKSFLLIQIPFFLTFLLPILLTTGPFLPDLAISICSIIFIINSIKNKLYKYYKNKFFIYFLIFYLILNISSLLSSNIIFSLSTSLVYLRFGIFSLSTWYLLDKEPKLIKYLFWSFTLVFSYLIVDGIFQYIFKHNLFGYPYIDGRVTSVFGKEKILGSYLSRLFPLFIGIYYALDKKNFNDNNLKKIISIVFVLTCFLILLSQERSSFFFLLITLSILLIFYFKKFYKKIALVFAILVFALAFLPKQNVRIINDTKQQVFYNNKIHLFSQQHEEHFLSSLKMFKDNPIIGIGTKAFRLWCQDKKYKVSEVSCNIHPHNTYVQLLGETGLMGFLFIFSIFIILLLKLINEFLKKIKKKKYISVSQLCFMICFFITLWPIIPTGNFFHNWLSIIYYFPAGFIIWSIKKIN